MLRQDGATGAISTVVLRASTDNLLDDLERAVDDGVNAYKCAEASPCAAECHAVSSLLNAAQTRCACAFAVAPTDSHRDLGCRPRQGQGQCQGQGCIFHQITIGQINQQASALPRS